MRVEPDQTAPPRGWMPKASVVIPSWNGARFLPTCLDALVRQSLGDPAAGDFEIIVVDNGSKDETQELLAAYPMVRDIRLPANQGFAAAVNVGIRAARADLIVLLNNDTQAEAGWLEALLKPFDEDARVGMVSSKVLLFDRRECLHTTGDTVDLAGMAANRGVWELDRGQYDERLEVFGANAAAAAYRRSLFEDVGVFEEAFGSYLEDVDLAWRARLAGWGCRFAPDARVYHHLSATGGGAYASFRVARNRFWLLVRNQPAALLLRHGHRFLAAQLGITWRALRTWRGEAARATLRGQLIGLVSWPRMLGHRRRIQASRRVSTIELETWLRMG